MRESIGAGWIMTIVITFLILFSGYLALSINYSKAFKVKDGIVDKLQKHNGPNAESIADIESYMSKIGYSSKGYCTEFSEDSLVYIGVNRGIYTMNGRDKYNYCIQKIANKSTTGTGMQMFGAYYKVIVFFTLSLPILDNISSFRISGETVYLQYPNDTCF